MATADDIFSGFYSPDVKVSSEDFSAAWLVSKDRFLLAEKRINVAANMAGASFAVVRQKCYNSSLCYNLMTRDYMDFMVEHLSPMSNHIPSGNQQIFAVAKEQSQATANKLKDLRTRKLKDVRSSQTMGVLVYSSNSFSVAKSISQEIIRHTYFQATFYSVRRYFQNITIFVANQKDKDTIIGMKLPYYQLINIPAPLDKRNCTTSLPRLSLETIINGTKAHDPLWEWVKYIYFTEGDQILHMRGIKHIFNAIDDSRGAFAVVPHRMQVCHDVCLIF